MPRSGYMKWKHPARGPTYSTWCSMHARCYHPQTRSYKDYGGRGIIVCERWHDYDLFYEDVGERPEGMTFGRIDNNKNYEPDNWQWETYKEQNRNRRNNIMVTYRGKTQCISAWAEELGLDNQAIRYRLLTGPSIGYALRKPDSDPTR
jgi:hypothetical protein